MNLNKYNFGSVLILFLMLLFPLIAQSNEIQFEAITKPSADIELSFIQPGKISEIVKHEGVVVQKGDLLISLEDEVEMVQYQIISARAGNTNGIDITRVEKNQKEKDFQKMEWALKKGAVTDWEVEHARMALDTANLNLKMAQFEREQNQLKQKELKKILDSLQLISPIDGVVEKINFEIGEAVQALSSVARVVKVDPLMINVAVPIAQAKLLSVKQNATITFEDNTTVPGNIENISTVANAAANTIEIKIIVPNNSQRPAGERVSVSFKNITEQDITISKTDNESM